jgi:hypothetical protein
VASILKSSEPQGASLKTVIAFALLLGLTIGCFSGLGYVAYQQHQQIGDLQFQITTLQTQVQTQGAMILQQGTAISKQRRSITSVQAQETLVAKAVLKVVEFLNAIVDQPEPQTKPNHFSETYAN